MKTIKNFDHAIWNDTLNDDVRLEIGDTLTGMSKNGTFEKMINIGQKKGLLKKYDEKQVKNILSKKQYRIEYFTKYNFTAKVSNMMGKIDLYILDFARMNEMNIDAMKQFVKIKDEQELIKKQQRMSDKQARKEIEDDETFKLVSFCYPELDECVIYRIDKNFESPEFDNEPELAKQISEYFSWRADNSYLPIESRTMRLTTERALIYKIGIQHKGVIYPINDLLKFVDIHNGIKTNSLKIKSLEEISINDFKVKNKYIDQACIDINIKFIKTFLKEEKNEIFILLSNFFDKFNNRYNHDKEYFYNCDELFKKSDYIELYHPSMIESCIQKYAKIKYFLQMTNESEREIFNNEFWNVKQLLNNNHKKVRDAKKPENLTEEEKKELDEIWELSTGAI